ncbi:MAG: hypothetical protein J0I06_12775 [Planctomycetes bacterium]|nr:hypothetical protein [Planctomycetota bacterium]
MFFELKVGPDVLLFNLSQVTRIRVAPYTGDLCAVTFHFTDESEETVSVSPTVLQRLHTTLPRSMAYGSGGMG